MARVPAQYPKTALDASRNFSSSSGITKICRWSPDKIIRPCKGLGRFRPLGPRQIENPPWAQFALFDLRQGHQPAVRGYRHPALHDRCVAPAQQYSLSAGEPAGVGGTHPQRRQCRQPGLDWQVWIQQGDYPLPRKLVITTTTDPARPRYTSVITWNLAPSFDDAAFTFEPPKDAKKIMFGRTPTGNSE